ncbi:MAG TPA: DNA-directed RNA polymerase subunit beta' [Thermomicrobiales bacterium]|nr:DNA-directed RNA polymerase subunit beta' [Thermomicrobiales bacterium]
MHRDEATRSLDVNNFDAIRISLASPEDIRSWSYGEVTKPETINYRTLKPEHGGLFCERIFGPSKDWECYCGKYKRIRHAGTVCDKCGVEVTRSKVRRERMGHIELAAPATHIWYVKGTPSRLGLLLDISPRNLERVLYFASYLVTEVDTEARDELIETIEAELAEELEELQAEFEERAAAIEAERDQEISNLEEGAVGVASNVRGQLEAQLAELEEVSKTIIETLESKMNESLDEDLKFNGKVLIEAGEAVNEDRLEEVRAAIADAMDDARREAERFTESTEAESEHEVEQIQLASEKSLRQLQNEYEQQQADLRAEADEIINQIRDLEQNQVLTETQYRELMDLAPGVFRAAMGAEAVYEVVSKLDLDSIAAELRTELHSTVSVQRKKKAAKRLRVVESLRKSGNRPEWMIFTALPVIPPDLRPMVQLDGGRFATSDLNDLYRRVINRNNRLKRLLELGAPDIIVRNEKRMLQEAVDALIDNGRRGRVVSGSGKHKLKSLSDMLKGKQGRFRQNLLGKRVDYSGRSVIVVGPDLKLYQCGLPKRMALELFKPFVMHRLVQHDFAHNIKAAKRLVERVDPSVWDVLEEVIKDYVVLLNRAPTLHRLGIQAFEVKLIEGSAIQLHPLVCAAFNADFDGDQMAVHVPLSRKAQAEARERMMSTVNLLDPSDGDPVIAPTLEIVLGCYYLTMRLEGRAYKGEGKVFASAAEMMTAYDLGLVDLHAKVRVMDPKVGAHVFDDERNGEDVAVREGLVETTVGRVIFNQELPASMPFRDQTMDRGALKRVIKDLYDTYGTARTAEIADRIKDIGFKFATLGGLTIGVDDVAIPEKKADLIAAAEERVLQVERQYNRGLLSPAERHDQLVEIWSETREQVQDAIEESFDEDNSLYIMTVSGAKGNMNQISQMAGMRGLMLDPRGNIMDFPIRSNFREGLSVFEYFISTHGARKGLADTALRTADSGYLTRKLVDVSQDVIVTIEDCGTTAGMRVNRSDVETDEIFADRILGRLAAEPIVTADGEILADRNEEINDDVVRNIFEADIQTVVVRSVMHCDAAHGVCASCYGRNLATGRMVELGDAVGIIAAQSIGEPGTQLTMRTFHTGGVLSADDITTGLPRVTELFEAREPKGKAILSEIGGTVSIVTEDEARKVIITHRDPISVPHQIPESHTLKVKDGQSVKRGDEIAVDESDTFAPITATISGDVVIEDGVVSIYNENAEIREYTVPHSAHLRVQDGEEIQPGTQITEGALDPDEVLRTRGREDVQRLLVDEVQKVYRSQGVVTNDRHIEIIVRQMLRKVGIDDPGDTDLLPGDLVDRYTFNEINEEIIAQGGEPATAQQALLGITKASLETESFLSAASFQETTRVLTQAAIEGKVDYLRGLKENVIIGKLIPAGSGFQVRQSLPDDLEPSELEDAEARELEPKSIEDVEDLVSPATRQDSIPLGSPDESD